MHKKIIVINSTPIIALSSIDEIILLKQLYNEVFIPEAVKNEIFAKPDSKAKNDIEKSLDWLIVKSISNTEARRFFKVQLHEGEVEVMILGKEMNADVLVIDDYIAREYAKHLDFKVTGTIGVLLKAKENKLIKEIKPLLNKLIKNGIYIGDKLYKEILMISNEL